MGNRQSNNKRIIYQKIKQKKIAELKGNTSSHFNSTNHYEYWPYYYKNEIIYMDMNWWKNDLLKESRDKMEKIILDEGLQLLLTYDLLIPHEFYVDEKTDIDVNKLLHNIYSIYVHQHDYQIWYPFVKHLIHPVHIIDISRMDAMALKYHTITSIVSSFKQRDRLYLKRLSPEFIKAINQLFETKYCPHHFVKLSDTSGKNERKLKFITNADELLAYLTDNKAFLQTYNNYINRDFLDLKLIVMKWKHIDDKYEFRIFIKNKKLIGISQQKWYDLDCSLKNPKKYKKIVDRIIELCDRLKPVLPYNTYIMDIYYDEVADIANLIEVNSWGMGFAGGSSLFHWINDVDIFHREHNNIYMRFLT